MKPEWPKAVLSTLLRQVSRPEDVNSLREYTMLGTRWYAGGLFKKDVQTGQSIKAARVYRVARGDFIYNRLFAWKGSFAVVNDESHGCYVSNEFPCFEVNLSKLDARYLLHYFTQAASWNKALGLSSGATPTSRNRLKEKQFLEMSIPLPSMTEQRRLVQWIEAISERVKDAKRLSGEAQVAADDLLIAMAHRRDLLDDVKHSRGWVRRKLLDCMQLAEDPVTVAVADSYPNVGIYSFGRGLFAKPPIVGIETSASRLFRVKAHQFIYSRLFAFEGAYGIVTDEFDGCFVSNEYPTFDCRPDIVRPEFLAAYFQAPTVWRAVATGSKGLGDRRQRVHPEQVLNHELWVPPVRYQDTLANISRQRALARGPIVECAAAIDAVLPAVLDQSFRENRQ